MHREQRDALIDMRWLLRETEGELKAGLKLAMARNGFHGERMIIINIYSSQSTNLLRPYTFGTHVQANLMG
jgi:hypothetical protein